MNVVTISGRAVKEIEMRFTPGGKGVANGTMAVQRNFKNAQGEYEADFVDFVLWGDKPCEILTQYVKKGDHFAITGELRTRTYEKDGIKRKITEVNVTSFDLPQRPKSQSNSQSSSQPQQRANEDDPFEVSDDMLPF